MTRSLDDLYYFAHVAEHGGFTAAAKALGIPKSTLSRRIAELEARLETRLLHRTTRRLTLTDVGRAYLAHCQDVVSAAEAADALVQQLRHEPRGKVTVTAPMPVSQTLLSRAVSEFVARYPRVTVDLDSTNRRVDLVAEGVDVAVRVRSTIEDSSLVIRRFAVSPAILVGSPELIRSHGSPEHPNDLEHQPTLSLRFSDGRHRLTFTGPGHDAVTVSLKPRLTTDDMWVLRDAAVAGIGFVSLPGYICHDLLAAGTLQTVLPQWRLPVGHIHVVYPHRRGLLPAVRHFIDFLAERLPELAEEMGVTRFCPEVGPTARQHRR